jgi:hypothetical protein
MLNEGSGSAGTSSSLFEQIQITIYDIQKSLSGLEADRDSIVGDVVVSLSSP